MVVDKIKRATKLFGFELARWSPVLAESIWVRPNSVSFKITANCNSLCITCGEWKEVSRGELTTEEIKRVMDDLKTLGLKNFYVSGGEPTLRRDLAEILEYARELGFSTGLTTHGLTLTESRARRLFEAGLGMIGFSVDGVGEVHDFVRGRKGFYDRTLRSIGIASELRREFDFKLMVGFTLNGVNMDTLVPLAKELIPFGVKMNVGLINFTTQQFKIADGKTMGLWPQDLDHLSEVIDEALALGKEHPDLFAALSSEWKTWALEYFKDPKGENIPCSIGYHKIYIDPHGWVYPCWPMDPTGNVREQSIREILASDKHRHTLHNMLRLNCPGCSCNTYSNRFNHLPRVLNKRFKGLLSPSPKVEQSPRGFDNLVES